MVDNYKPDRTPCCFIINVVASLYSPLLLVSCCRLAQPATSRVADAGRGVAMALLSVCQRYRLSKRSGYTNNLRNEGIINGRN